MYSQIADLRYCKYLLNYKTDQHEISGQYLDNENVSMVKYSYVITNPRWRTTAILKIAKSPYLSEKSSDFDEIWYTTSDIQPDDSHVIQKLKFFNIQDGGGRHLENHFFGHNSSTDCPISAKFCTRNIKDGGRPPFLKSLNHHISVKNRLILMKFGTLQQILNPMTVT